MRRLLPFPLPALLSGALALSPFAVQADVLLPFNPTIRSNLCVGLGCADSETYGSATQTILRLRSAQVWIELDDASAPSSGVPVTDWHLISNENFVGGDGYFAIRNDTDDRVPFRIQEGAEDNALYLDDDGNLGLGTALPQRDIEVQSGMSPTLRLRQNTSRAQSPYTWDVTGSHTGFDVVDINNLSTVPFGVDAGSGAAALRVTATGVGVGLAAPLATLHVHRNDGSAAVLIEETNATPAPRQLLRLSNNGQTYFTLEDTSITAGDNSGRAWNFQNLGGEFRVTTAPGGGSDIEMRLTTGGDMIIEGNYFASSGTELNVPDYVFDADYDLKPLSEVQAFIDTHSHLPGVPSAAEINETGLNMTDMQMRLLKKVEELTLYTLEQEAQLAEVPALRAELTRMDALEAENAALVEQLALQDARLAQIETALAAR